jgi:hypothetical protein
MIKDETIKDETINDWILRAPELRSRLLVVKNQLSTLMTMKPTC